MKAVVGVWVVVMASGCTPQVECGDGTVELDGVCEPIICGEDAVLVGDHCEPIEPPTGCVRTEPVTDPDTGVTTYDSTGTCTAPTLAMKQSVCGQIYDFADNTRLGSDTCQCLLCDPNSPLTVGPCALKITAFNAQALAAGTAEPLSVGKAFINTCGHFKLQDIDTAKAGSFIALVVDDATATTIPDPTGITVTTAMAFKTVEKTAVKDFEAWIVKPDTANAWTGATLTTGVYAAIFRAHKPAPVMNPAELLVNQAGVTITQSGTDPSNEIPDNDFYFDPAATTRTTITADTVTGANGTALVDNASWASGLYAGRGGLGTGCAWEQHAGASIPGVVFVQVFRKLDATPQTCND